jgi:ATP synthase mitochondrial F1 complex assembly factor 2
MWHRAQCRRSLGPQFASPSTRQLCWTSAPWKARHYATTTVSDGPPITETNRMSSACHTSFYVHLRGILVGAQATLKRFWKTVGIDKQGDAFTVTLDKRPLKTPAGKTLLLPKNKALLATLIAHEWETQETLLKPHALPMVLASRYPW